MLDVAMTGGVPHKVAWNMGRFEYLRAHPDEARGFDAMMANFPDNRHAAVAAAYDFSNAALIADIGGGNGAMLRSILTREMSGNRLAPSSITSSRIGMAPRCAYEL